MMSDCRLSDPSKGRCINIDWLEVYSLESVEHFPHNADYFRSQHWQVIERPYGTRQYKEMFTLLDVHGEPFCEIRRNPVSSEEDSRNKGIFSEFSAHIRLVNRYCYHNDCVNLFSEFLARYQYEVVRLFRLDLALDFEKFDKGDDPFIFLQRYMAGRYSKINQGNLTGHAKDRWESRDWNSASWGSPKSMVSTKLYNKSLELAEAKDKPYIRLAWQAAGLVDDYITLVKHRDDGTTYKPTIWRVEFSIKSSARAWFMVEDNNGKKTKTFQHEHTLATYASKEAQLHAFEFLAHHYFHFKKFVPAQRKDRCPDKVLFDFRYDHTPYKLDVLATATPARTTLDSLRVKLMHYRATHFDSASIEACDTLIQAIEREEVRSCMPYDAAQSDRSLLQYLLSLRITQNPKEPMATSIEKAKALIDFERTLFNSE